MKAIKIDGDRNPVMKGGRFIWVTDIDVVLQNCDQAMRQQLGELNYSARRGVQYFGNVFENNPNYQLFEAQARKALRSVSGVVAVDDFTYNLVGESLSYTAIIKTIYGTGSINGNV